MKRFLIIFLFALLCFPISSFALPNSNNIDYVYDDAHLISDDVVQYIQEYSQFLYEAKQVQYYVVTVQNLGMNSVEDFTEDVFQSLRLGERGVLILYAKDEMTLRIKFGTELDSILSNDEIVEFIDTYFFPFFEVGDWANGFKNGYSSLYKCICQFYDIDASEMEVSNKVDFLTKYSSIIVMFIAWIATTICYVFCRILLNLFQKKYTFFEILLLIILFFIHLLLFYYAYSLNHRSVYVILILDLLAVFTNFSSLNRSKEKVRHTKKKKKSR